MFSLLYHGTSLLLFSHIMCLVVKFDVCFPFLDCDLLILEVLI